MNPPSFSEEKLTAYALNELSPAERREVEAELSAHPELKAELEAIQALAQQLREELSLEAGDFEKSPLEAHSDKWNAPKAEVEPEDGKIISFRRHPWFYASGLLAVAACAALMFLPSLSVDLHPAQKMDRGSVAAQPSSPVTNESLPVSTQVLAQAEELPAAADELSALTPPAMNTAEADQDGFPGNRSSETKKGAVVFGTSVEGQSQSLITAENVDAKAYGYASNHSLSLPSSAAPARSPEQSKGLVESNKSSLTEVITRGAVVTYEKAPPSEAMVKEEISPAPAAISAPSAKPAQQATAMTRAGSGQLAGSNTYTGGTTVSGGVVGMNGTFAGKDLYYDSWGGARRADDSRTRDLQANTASLQEREALRLQGYFQKLKTAPASGESYLPITDNPFLRVADQALSTFSIDVDTGAYTNLRRFLNQGQLPPPDAVRIEELVNYFNYNYPQPKGEDPFSVNTEVARAPWKNDHLLVRIGLQGKTVAAADRPPANLVFLIDVSGSMDEPNKLPLVINSMKLLVQKLKPEDRVGIAVYAGNSGMVLPSTSVSHRGEILEALGNLQAGGSTNGAMGIQLAYDMAKAHYIEGGINRVILCTDGDFNVGVTNRGDLIKLIEEKAKSKVFLSVFGFGMGNLQDATLEQLANKGNGNYGYIDNPKEAKRVFVDQVGGTLQTIAKDVKIQVEFNPAVVSSYRLIGYENRMLAAKDFNDDKKDAGEIGAGHRVTALYEIVPVGVKEDAPSIDPLKYQKPAPVEYAGDKSEIMNVKLRYKQPEGDTSKLLEHPVKNENILSFTAEKAGWFRSAPQVASDDFQFAAGVAAFGMILRDSPYMNETNFDLVLQLTGKGAGNKQEDRVEFITLVKKAKTMFNPDSKQLRAY